MWALKVIWYFFYLLKSLLRAVNKQPHTPLAADKSWSQCQGFLSMMDWIPEPCIKRKVSSFSFLYCFVVFIAVVVLFCQIFGCNEAKKILTLKIVNNYQTSSKTFCKFLSIWYGIFIWHMKLKISYSMLFVESQNEISQAYRTAEIIHLELHNWTKMEPKFF